MKIQRSIDIKATPEKIWPFLVEPEKILKWFTHLQQFEYTGQQRNSIGTTFYYEEKSSGKLMKMNYKVTEWVKNKKIAFSVTSGSLKKDDQVWSIEAMQTGSRFTWFEDLDLGMGIFGNVIGPFAKMMIGKSLQDMIAILKGLAEA
jgi:carbon monoxide dehydrogenase subunit G